jgi:hypothetical protein
MAGLLGGKSVVVLFFTIVIALFVYFIYFLVTGSRDPAYYWQQHPQRTVASTKPPADTAPSPGAVQHKSFILIRNNAQTVGKLRITYLGLADNHLRFDVNLLDLDPNFAYRYAIPLDQAKKRFRIADQYFKANATSNSKIRLSQMALQ